MGELVAKDKQEYLQKAIFLAKNKNHLNKLKIKIIDSRNENPIFDNIIFTKNIEKSYSLVFEKKLKNEQAQDIYL